MPSARLDTLSSVLVLISFSPPPHEQYIEADYLTFETAEREAGAITRRLKELQLRTRKNQLRATSQYLSGDTCQTLGLNSLATIQRDYVHMVAPTQRQILRLDATFVTAMTFVHPDISYVNGQINLHTIAAPSTTILTIVSSITRIVHPRLNDRSPGHFTEIKPQFVRSQTSTPTSSPSGYRRDSRSLRRPRPYILRRPFIRRRHNLLKHRNNEQLQTLQSYNPLRQFPSISESHAVETLSDDGLLEKFAILLDVPTDLGKQINKSTPSFPRTAPPSPRAKTLYDCATLGEVGFADFFRVPEPSVGFALSQESKDHAASSTEVPAESTFTEGKLDTQVLNTSTPTAADIDTISPKIAFPFDKIRTIEAAFNALKENFTLPAELDFLPSTPLLHPRPPHLPLPTQKRQALTVLLEQLDGVESLGDAHVRRSRKEVVRRVKRALEELKREVERRWRVRVEKEGVNGEDEVSELGLDESESGSEREVDAQEAEFDERVDISEPSLNESSVNQDNSSPNDTVTTIRSSDNVSELTATTPVHDVIAIEAILGHQHSDTASVVDIPVSADTAEPIESINSIPSSLQPFKNASATNTISVFTLSVSESTPTTLSVDVTTEPIIPVDIADQSTAESPLASLDASSLNENAELIAIDLTSTPLPPPLYSFAAPILKRRTSMSSL
ncbi:hypothetical protein H2248_007860 [Termitomyces sp. 'cryptogamus']|nr:hypothetical protein H2248_007860 [Termitomyces sp. 'cryptogamus']